MTGGDEEKWKGNENAGADTNQEEHDDKLVGVVNGIMDCLQLVIVLGTTYTSLLASIVAEGEEAVFFL